MISKFIMTVSVAFVLVSTAWPAPQEDAQQKKALKEKMDELRKGLASTDEGGKLGAIRGLGEIATDEAIPLLAGKLAADTDAVRIAAARAIALHRRPASVKALANAIPSNQFKAEVLTAFIGALEELDMCSSIGVLLGIAEVNKNSLGEPALKAIAKIGCSECLAALVNLLQRAEVEEKKPDIFEGTDDAPESENRQQNKTLAALAPHIREILSGLAGKPYGGNAREWSQALASGRVPLKRTSVYLCLLKETTFEVSSGQAKKCPYGDGKTLHEDVFLKHLRE